jgi:amino acid transporter
MPTLQLCIQGIIFLLLSSAFIVMPSVNSAFWFLSAAASQFSLIYYLFVFAAAVRLRTKYPNLYRPFKAGNSSFTFHLVCGMGAVTCLLAFLFGFLPPSDMNASSLALYEVSLSGLIFLGIGLGLGIYQVCQRKSRISRYLGYNIGS